MDKVVIHTEYIKLDQLLKWIGIADNGSIAKIIISSGDVKLNGNVVLERGKKIRKGDIIEIAGAGSYEIVTGE